jgi:hypothetical protein
MEESVLCKEVTSIKPEIEPLTFFPKPVTLLGFPSCWLWSSWGQISDVSLIDSFLYYTERQAYEIVVL